MFGAIIAYADSTCLGNSSVIDPVVVNEWQHPFRYNDEWTGTALPWLELPEAIYHAHNNLAAQIQGLGHDPIWSMGRWPDPILRRVAEPVSSEWIGTRELQQAGEILRTTARKNQAVGLAAQQCGVNARLVFLEYQQSGGFLSRLDVASLGLTMVNPIIVARSPEIELQVWRERCLVLPPTFEATVLRDAWVVVQYQTPSAANNAENQFHQIRLRGEYARAVQHELDHDRGILVTDHVDLDELESDLMRRIEQQGHDLRMRRAYARATGV